MANKHMEKYSAFLFIREMQIKIIMRYSHRPTRMVKIKKSDNSKYWQACGATGIHTLLVGV